MTVEYHINERDELITLTAKGTVEGSQACACIDELLNDSAFEANLPQLVDLREALFSGTEEDLERFKDFLLDNYQPRLNAGVAIVVNPDWDQETCAQAFWVSCALGCAELFDNWNQACKWLIKQEFSANLVNLDTHQSDSSACCQEVVEEIASKAPATPQD